MHPQTIPIDRQHLAAEQGISLAGVGAEQFGPNLIYAQFAEALQERPAVPTGRLA